LEAEEREKERLEAERLKAHKEWVRMEAEQQQREKERLEAEQREKERLEALRQEKQRLGAEQREKQRVEAEQPKKEDGTKSQTPTRSKFNWKITIFRITTAIWPFRARVADDNWHRFCSAGFLIWRVTAPKK
jgi:hypothetical protein